MILKRIFKNDNYSIGKLYYKGEYVCDILENAKYIIPKGKYKIDWNTISNRFGNIDYYKKVCKGRLPRLIGVPQRAGILIHKGNYPKDSKGCLLCGYNLKKGMVLNSAEAFEKICKIKDNYIEIC